MLKQKFIVNYGSSLIMTMIGMFAGIFVARFAGPDVLGTLATATATVSIFGFIKGLWGTAHIKLLSEGENENDCLATYTVLQVSSIFLFVVVVAGYLLGREYLFHIPFETNTLKVVTWIMLGAIFIESFTSMNEPTFNGKMQISKMNVISLVRQLIFHPGRIILVMLGFMAIPLALWYMVSAIIVLPLSYRLFREIKLGKFNKEYFKRHIQIVIPIFLIVVINAFIASADKLILQHYTNTREVGYYTAAHSLGGIILLIGSTTGNIFFPMFSKAISQKDYNYVNDKINKYLTFCFIFILPGTLFLVLAGDPLLIWVLGTKYYPSIIPFSLLLIASFMMVIGMPFQNTISGAGKFNLVVLLQFMKFLFFTASLFLLINPDFGGMGATGLAVNLLLVNLFQNGISYFVSKRFLPLRIEKRILILAMLVSAVFLAFYFVITYLRSQMGNVAVVGLSIAFFVMVYGLLRLFRLLNKSDLDNLASIVNIGKTVRYFRDELRKK